MALTVRLGPKAERTLNRLARRRGLSRSDVVREALAHYEAADASRGTDSRPYDAWIDVIGVVRLGLRDPKRTTGEQFATIVQGARGRHPR
jgi:Arc/MetJ-type ribon-helix-helix transcriptional regulator